MQYLQKSIGDEVDFLPADKHESFVQVIVSLLGLHTRHAHDTQNDRFTTSLQYLKENVKDEVNILHEDKR